MTHLQTFINAFEGSQRDFAKEIGISEPHLSALSSGKKRPSLKLAVRIERLTKGAVSAASWVFPKIH